MDLLPHDRVPNPRDCVASLSPSFSSLPLCPPVPKDPSPTELILLFPYSSGSKLHIPSVETGQRVGVKRVSGLSNGRSSIRVQLRYLLRSPSTIFQTRAGITDRRVSRQVA